MATRNFNLGRIVPKPQGAYDAETTYQYLDIVSYNGSSYIAKQTTTGNVPTNTTYWDLMAAGGELAGTLTSDQLAAIVAQVLATAGLVVDADYVHSDNNLTDAMVAAIAGISTPNNGVLTIKRNGTTVGTFSADASGNVTVDLAVPTAVSELSGGSGLFGPLDLVEIADITAGVIDALKSGTVYDFKASLVSLNVAALSYTANDATRKAEHQHSYIYFTAGATFNPTLPEGCYCNVAAFEEGYAYKVEVEGNLFTATKFIIN